MNRKQWERFLTGHNTSEEIERVELYLKTVEAAALASALVKYIKALKKGQAARF